jgi:hypothetical protein
VADATIEESDCDLYSEAGVWSCLEEGSYAHGFTEHPNGSQLSVFVVKSLRIAAGVSVKTREGFPVVVVALEDMTLLGSLEVLAGTAGGGFNTEPYATGMGGGGGFRGLVSDGRLLSGQGASFCGAGGRAEVMLGSTRGEPRQTYGSAELSPLLAGSSGGSGVVPNTGAGGGAIQLIAGGKLTLGKGALINAPGGGGAAGRTDQPASGGGSGGAVLLEATSFDLQGTISANGGGGGQGVGSDGADGRSDDVPAAGGAEELDGMVSSPGGDGGAGESVDGVDGTIDGDMNPGAGGGGVGRIRLNYRGDLPDLSRAFLSPAPTTDCFSLGAI